MSRTKTVVSGETLLLDFELFKKEQEYYKKKEDEFWEYYMSGRWCEDVYGKGNCPHRREHDGSVGEI